MSVGTSKINDMDTKQRIQIANKILNHEVGVMPTDTVYGIVGRANNKTIIDRIYKVKHREASKPFIILISDVKQLDLFSIILNANQRHALQSVWPGPVSVIIECPNDELTYLHRGTHSLAFRMPALTWLTALIAQTGPIIATSANTSGQPTVDTVEVAKQQLPHLDFYYNGPSTQQPSALLRLNSDGTFIPIERKST